MTDTKACVAVFSWDQLWVYPLLRELLYAGVYAEIRSVCALDLLVCARDLLVCAREVCISGYTCVSVCLSVCVCVCGMHYISCVLRYVYTHKNVLSSGACPSGRGAPLFFVSSLCACVRVFVTCITYHTYTYTSVHTHTHTHMLCVFVVRMRRRTRLLTPTCPPAQRRRATAAARGRDRRGRRRARRRQQ